VTRTQYEAPHSAALSSHVPSAYYNRPAECYFRSHFSKFCYPQQGGRCSDGAGLRGGQPSGRCSDGAGLRGGQSSGRCSDGAGLRGGQPSGRGSGAGSS
jgi:hypothetical protein